MKRSKKTTMKKRRKTAITRKQFHPVRESSFPGNSCKILIIVAGIALFSFASSGANRGPHAEKPYALIFGTVWSPEGLPVYGVKVNIRAAGKKAHWELYSDHSGEFAQRVPAGKADYLVTADLKGYKAPAGMRLQGGAEVTVHVENDERIDIGLHLK